MLIDFLRFFGRCFDHFDLHFGLSFWVQNPQIDQKSIPKCTSILIPFFDRFLIDFRSQTGAPEPQKWCFRLRKRYFRSKTVFFNMIPFWDRFWSQLGSILVPKRAQNRSQKRSNKSPNFDRFFDRCLVPFGCLLGAMLGPVVVFWSIFGPF